MTKYIVEQMAQVWYRVEVEADSVDEAKELGEDSLSEGEGTPNPDWIFADHFWILNTETDESESF